MDRPFTSPDSLVSAVETVLNEGKSKKRHYKFNVITAPTHEKHELEVDVTVDGKPMGVSAISTDASWKQYLKNLDREGDTYEITDNRKK